jgi:RNA-splicing ligase RtcB
MLDVLLSCLGVEPLQCIESVHNYIDMGDRIIRKGSISAHEGEDLLIPLNMGDGVIIGTGNSTSERNYSAPHGAGRIMGRKKAKEQLDIKDFKELMNDRGVWSSCVSRATLDESPMAYKNAQQLIDNLGNSVVIKATAKPVYNFKAS